MKSIHILDLIVLFLCIFFFVSFVSAEVQPFSQCIQVINMSSSVGYSGLSCVFTDSIYSTAMLETFSGIYCANISSHLDGAYPFSVLCTDGLLNKSISGSLSVSSDEGGFLSPSHIVPTSSKFSISQVGDYLKENPVVFVGLVLVVFLLAWLLGRKRT